MASKPSPAKNSKLIQKYMDVYSARKKYRHETIYTITLDEFAGICDFADPKKSRVFLCFYNFPAEKYDEMSLTDLYAFAEGNNQYPHSRYRMTDNGIVAGVNVCVPARDGVVDKALINEILSHELTHIYIMYNEYLAGHILHPATGKRKRLEKEEVKRNPNIKYTFSQKMDRYNSILFGMKFDGGIRDNFNWIGYSLTKHEINATLAGIDAFLYENNGDYERLPVCRSIIMMKKMRDYLKEIQKSATDEDWEYCRKKALYIHERKDESLERFKKRYIAYYTKQLDDFDKSIEKLVKKYKLKTGQKKLQTPKQNHGITRFVRDTYEM